MKYHLTPVKMAINKKSTKNKCWKGCGEKGLLLYCWWECKLVQTLWMTVGDSLKKKKKKKQLRKKPPYETANPHQGKYPEETKLKNTHVSQFSLQHYLQ